MIDLRRVKQRWNTPIYRTKLGFFILLGSATILLAFLVKDPPWQNILLDFAIVFIAVALVQLVWDFLGGSPELAENADQIRSIVVLGDMLEHNIGLERIWPDHRTWTADQSDGRCAWQTRMSTAHRIDLMGSTLWGWVHDASFRESLIASVDHGAHMRLLLYDPDSNVVRDHANAVIEHSDEAGFTPNYMQAEIRATLKTLYQCCKRTSKPTNLEIRLTYRSLHWAQIVRADEQMIVTTYLAAKSAGPCPVMQIRGAQSSYLEKYAEQFEIMWNRARPVGISELSTYLDE